MGNADSLWKALFWIRTSRKHLEIFRTKDIVEEGNNNKKKQRSQESLGFFLLNETEQLIAPSSGGLPACFLIPRDFTRSLWKSSVGPYIEEDDKTLNTSLWVSLPRRLEQHLTLKQRGPELPSSRPHIRKPRKPKAPNPQEPTRRACAWTVSVSAPQQPQGSKKPEGLY